MVEFSSVICTRVVPLVFRSRHDGEVPDTLIDVFTPGCRAFRTDSGVMVEGVERPLLVAVEDNTFTGATLPEGGGGLPLPDAPPEDDITSRQL